MLIQVTQNGQSIPNEEIDDKYHITGVDYEDAKEGKLTDTGIDDMIAKGQNLRDNFISSEKLLPNEYERAAY